MDNPWNNCNSCNSRVINGKMDDMKIRKKKMQKGIRNLNGQRTQHLHKCFQHRMQKYGEVVSDSSDYLYVYIYDMDKKEFKDYVSKCKENGFTVDYSGSDTSYLAKNDNGYEVSLNYSDYDGRK